ncbi:MAG: HesA/MoeB/ThiF family protein [Planctomycetota bacterium]
MKKDNIVRYSQVDFEALKKHFEAADPNETQIFSLFSHAFSRKCNIYTAKIHLLPDQKELRNQSPVSIEPSCEFQAIAYGLACETGKSVGDQHNHPFTDKPHFSSVDGYHGKKNAAYLSEYLPDSATMLMVVFGEGLKHFQARVWNRKKSCFEPLERLEVLGSPTHILEEHTSANVSGDDPYARHRIIPGWEQGRLEKLKALVAGLGGNGALVWQSLVALGVGKSTGWLRACDRDEVKASNLPRIPYAHTKDVGKLKAVIAEAYARHKDPDINASCYCESIDSERMLDFAKEANVMFSCVDADGPRKILNRCAVRYVIPLVDIGSEIIPGKDSYEAVGQVRIVIPGKTGCLMCSGIIDPSEAALDLLPEEVQKQRARAGYVRGTGQTPTPSVLHLNGVTSHLAVSQFLRLVFGEGLSGKEFVHYDRQGCQMLAAFVPPDPDCPVCGSKGYLGAGDDECEFMTHGGDRPIERFELRDGKVIEKSGKQSDDPESRAQGSNSCDKKTRMVDKGTDSNAS